MIRYFSLCIAVLFCPMALGAAGPDYSREVAPILSRYCAGCHNAEDREAEFSVESFADLQRGGEQGRVLVPGRAAESVLLRVLTGKAEPRMPPEDNEQPTRDEIAVLRAWIDSGARGPARGEPSRRDLRTPKIDTRAEVRPITALDISPDGALVAIARFQEVEVTDANNATFRFDEFPGKVNSVQFSHDGSQLVTASGVTGLYGQATVWNVADGTRVRDFVEHRDILFDAELSPDGEVLATCSYDRKVAIWNVRSGEVLRTLGGHNDAVYDLAFSPDGSVLATASGDETVKLWQVATGERLDTLSQPQAEQYTVTFSPDGQYVLAGGADNRIRVWRFVSKTRQRINPLEYARFAHEGAIVGLAFSHDGSTLVSTAEDLTLKLWEAETYTQTHIYEPQSDLVSGLALSAGEILVGRADGSTHRYEVLRDHRADAHVVAAAESLPARVGDSTNRVIEHEPNDQAATAMRVHLPARIEGKIATHDEAGHDADLFRFKSDAGQQWVIEVNAARSKSLLDSKIEVLDVQGNPIERVILRATRDSYFTFRGKDSSAFDDFRVHNWEEMELNQYLYAKGEVVKLWHYPRGPDSGYQVYPGHGTRHAFFDTTVMSHALHEPCYIVEPYAPGTELIANGLPVFRLYYENDDDSRRELGSDSRLTFRASAAGEYLARIVDARGFGGADFGYELTIRPRQPGFEVSLSGVDLAVGPGSAKEFTVDARRLDGFDGEIQLDIENLPRGFHASTPLVIQAGQIRATGIVYADQDAPEPSSEASKQARVVASASIHGKRRQQDPFPLGEIKLAEKPKLTVRVAAIGEQRNEEADGPLELVVAPGETIEARVQIERNGFEERVGFGNADAGRNLPHGVYVDNIGLNGLLIVEGQSERTFFITAAPWVPETTRLFHLRTEAGEKVASLPVLLHVRAPDVVASRER